MLTVADALTAVTRTTSVSTAYCLYHVPTSGKGITFGKIAEGDGFCVAMPARFTAGLTEELAVLASGDCNQLTDSGRCYCGSNVDNKPYPLNGWLDVRSYDDGAYDDGDQPYDEVWRRNEDGTQTEYYTLLCEKFGYPNATDTLW